MTAANGEDFKAAAASQFTRQSERLALSPSAKDHTTQAGTAVEAKFVTPLDNIIVTADGGRLPAVPPNEARKLNRFRNIVQGEEDDKGETVNDGIYQGDEQGNTEALKASQGSLPETDEVTVAGSGSVHQSPSTSAKEEPSLRTAHVPYRTNPLFPPLPLYGPPSLMRDIQCSALRLSSAFLSLAFLGVIVLGSVFTSIPLMFKYVGIRLTGGNPNARRPFYEEEKRRKQARHQASQAWKRQKSRKSNAMSTRGSQHNDVESGQTGEFEPTEGGKDPIICDVGYYARRVGLDIEEYEVQTEDGFIIDLWHVYHPKEYTPISAERRSYRKPDVFPNDFVANGRLHGASGTQYRDGKRRYPILLMHGLLQSSGAYCSNDDDSLAFYLCKSGYDVWLGNNRCGFEPKHQMLNYSDPRMWAWNIRQMGVIDLPALISRVLSETGFEKLGLVCHSQGTTATFVALAKEQRPELGHKISVFCALAPAVYAGPLIGKMYFKFMRIISNGMFRVFFGIHAFIPFMMTMHRVLPGKLYGALGYRVFSFLFNWTDDRWEQDLRDRMFQFAPVYVSAESMRWWLGRECFAKQKCILATKEEARVEDKEDEGEDSEAQNADSQVAVREVGTDEQRRGRSAWYDAQVPPFALWIAGSDKLVDGKRLLRRFGRDREPHARIVHSKVIEEYEHLDVIWAMDSIEKVGREVRDVLWKTMPPSARGICRVPRECEEIEALET